MTLILQLIEKEIPNRPKLLLNFEIYKKIKKIN